MSLYNQFPNPLDPLIAKVAYDSFNQIYKTMQSTKKHSIAAVMQYYESLNTKYTAMQNNGEVSITLNSRHDYLNPNHDTKKILFIEKTKELNSHKIAEILGIKEAVEKPKGTYPKKLKITLNKDTLTLLKKEAPGICREYETFLENKKAELDKKIKRIEDIFSTVQGLNKKISKAKNSVTDPLSDYITGCLKYYKEYKDSLAIDKKLLVDKTKGVLKLPDGNLIFTNDSSQGTDLKIKLLSLIERAEKRVDRIIMILEKIDSYVNRMSNKSHKAKLN